MKNYLLLALLFASQGLFAQNGATRGDLQIDNILIVALGEDFPNATNINWFKAGQNFEARFEHNTYQIKVLYSPDGMVLFKEFVVPKNKYTSLKVIWENLAETYPGYSLNGIYLCDAITKEYYCADIRYRGQNMKLKYDTELLRPIN